MAFYAHVCIPKTTQTVWKRKRNAALLLPFLI